LCGVGDGAVVAVVRLEAESAAARSVEKEQARQLATLQDAATAHAAEMAAAQAAASGLRAENAELRRCATGRRRRIEL